MNDQDEMFEAATETPVSLVPPPVIAHDEPANSIQKRREIEHFSLGNGLFPIHTVRTPGGSMGKVEIEGRKFAYSCVDTSGPDDHACTIRFYDNEQHFMFISLTRGRSMGDQIAISALKKYITRLGGHGGFLKRAVARAKEVGARQDASESSPLQCRNRKGECDSKRKSTPREPLPVQLLQRLKGRIADWDALADRFYKAREEDRGRILCEALDIELRPVSKEGSKCQ